MADEMVAGAAMGSAFHLLLGSVQRTTENAVIYKDKLKKIQTKLEALSPVIEQMTKHDMVLGLPSSELERFVILLKEGEKLVGECSKIKMWKFLKRSRYADKLNQFDESLNIFFELPQLQIARDTPEILKLVREIHEKIDTIESRSESSTIIEGSTQILFENNYEISPPDFISGLDAPLKDLKKKLLRKDRSVLVLTAPGGYGKTTLVKMLCRDDQIKEKFKTNILFVKVSRTPNLKLIVQELYQNMGLKVPSLQDDEVVYQLEQFLTGALGENPILLVLDDVWLSSESLIKKLISFKIPEYKILVTSRFVFPSFGPKYELEALKHEGATTLFCHHAFSKSESSHNIPDDLVNKVVEYCKGIPLALILVGSSLCNRPQEIWEREVSKWSKDKLSNELFAGRFSNEVFASLQSSIDFLDQKDAILKECFMDLGSFPEDQAIPATALIDLWTELYEIKDNDAFNHLLDLTYYNMANLEDIGNDMEEEEEEEEGDDDYNEIFVTQRDLLRELAIHQSTQDREQQRRKLIVDLSGGNLPSWWKKKNEQPFNARLVSISTDQSFSLKWCDMQLPEAEALVLNFQSKTHALPEFVKTMSKLKVLIVSNFYYFHTKLSNFHILGSLTNLKRIRLEGIAITSLSETHIILKNLQKLSLVKCEIGQAIKISEVLPNLVEINIEYCMDLVELLVGLCCLTNLKKISIIGCLLNSLPEEIGNLDNLEVLRLRCCINLKQLPDSICKLSKLTFLDISDCLNIHNLPEHIGKLHRLTKLNMKNCNRLLELPPSVSELKQLTDVVCSKRLKEQWELYLACYDNIKLKLIEDVDAEVLFNLWKFLYL